MLRLSHVDRFTLSSSRRFLTAAAALLPFTWLSEIGGQGLFFLFDSKEIAKPRRDQRGMLFALRTLALVLGLSLIVGESLRSWGQDRNLLFVIDDFLVGIPLVVMSVIMGVPSSSRLCGLCAAFGATTAMLYGSFFMKLADPALPQASNLDIGFLTVLVGLAFAASFVGLALSLVFASRMDQASHK